MSWLQKNCVVVPIDFSDAALAVVAPALEFVKDPSHLHVIHVLPDLHPADPAVVWDTVDEATRKAHAKEALQDKLSEFSAQDMQIEVVIGDPSSAILDYAQDLAADLIVMSSHGRTGMSRFMLGSVAERVVRLSKCPVLVIR
ncbi:MAG: universal stress protein [Cyanophyceae cyanobacterium]